MSSSEPVNRGPSNTVPAGTESLLAFFVLVLLLSIPFWIAGAATTAHLLPGLPVSALMFVCPGAAALILVYRKRRLEGAGELLRRGLDYRSVRAKIWLAPILLLMPAIMTLSFLWMRWSGVRVPAPRFSLSSATIMLVAFFLSALGEELGWSGYATDLMLEKGNAFATAMLLGAIWAVWHFVPLLQVHRSPEWIAWWTLGTVAARILIVWIYIRTGRSVFAATVFHAMIDLTWQLFPISGSYYDPRITGVIIAFVAAIVVIGRGPATLARSAEKYIAKRR